MPPVPARSRIRSLELPPTAGGNHAFTLALTTLVDAGDEVILPAPYFTNHQMAVVAAGADAIEAPVADRATFAVRWSDVEPHLTARTKAVVLCNPSNPTGAPVDAAGGRLIVERLADRGVVVISDDTYMQFVYDGVHWSAASVPAWRRNVVVVGTFSKAFGMMGWRVGFLLADAAICEQAVKVQDAMIICAPAMSQMAAEAAVHGCTGRRRAAACSLSPESTTATTRRRCRTTFSSGRTSSRFPARRSAGAARGACGCPTATPPPTSWPRPPTGCAASSPRGRSPVRLKPDTTCEAGRHMANSGILCRNTREDQP